MSSCHGDWRSQSWDVSISDRSRGRRRGKCLTSWGRDDTDTDDQMLKLVRDLGIGSVVVEHSNTVWPSNIIAGVREGLECRGMFYKHVEGGYSADYLSASLLLPWHGWLRHCTPIMGSNEWINFFCGVFWGEAAAPQRSDAASPPTQLQLSRGKTSSDCGDERSWSAAGVRLADLWEQIRCIVCSIHTQPSETPAVSIIYKGSRSCIAL